MRQAVCEHCADTFTDGGVGRVPRFCSTRHRVAAHRARKRAIPAAMRERRQWVRRSSSKVPLTAAGKAASSTDPTTWSSFAEVSAAGPGVGVGFVLAPGDGIVCIDLDHCLNGARVASWAQAVLDACPATFVEVSPSGTGLHVFGLGHVGRGRKIRRADGACIEVYDRGRYMAITGRAHAGAPSGLADLSAVLASL